LVGWHRQVRVCSHDLTEPRLNHEPIKDWSQTSDDRGIAAAARTRASVKTLDGHAIKSNLPQECV
jgi:hypothetical protein